MATKTVACKCSSFEFGVTVDLDNGDVDFQGYGTGCAQATSRTFAMGHDAKLVGFLVRAELGGEEIVLDQGGVRHIFGSAVNAAGAISPALAAKAQAQIDAARARIAKKASTEAAKTARKSAKVADLVAKVAVEAPKPTSRLANIKVGRWVYTAKIDLATGEATYSDKQGNPKTVASDKYIEQV